MQDHKTTLAARQGTRIARILLLYYTAFDRRHHVDAKAEHRFHLVALATIAAWAVSTAAVACVEGDVRGEAVTIEREVGTTASGEEAAIRVLGAGWFRVAEIVKHGGNTDNTSVTLELDGEPMITISFATLKNQWNQSETPFFVAKVSTEGDTSRMTIWYSPELKFRGMMTLRVEVGEDGVAALRMRTVMNKPAPHEHIAGQLGIAGMPAFR
jgi:hypothetical protein